MRQNVPEMGRTAVTLLREQLDPARTPRQRAVLETELVLRESTAPPPDPRA